MKKRNLGNSDITMTPLAFGGNVFGWTLDETRSFAMLDAIVDHGIDMIDSANVYSAWVDGNHGGESETIIGKWLAQSGKRDRVIIGTKVGMPMGDGSKGLGKEYIIQSAEDSLKRLQTDYIDIYYAHQDDGTVPFEETLEAFTSLIKDGKVRYIASSNYSAKRLNDIMHVSKDKKLPQFIAHQPEYNLYSRSSFEGPLEDVCVQHGLGVVSYFSLASGFLSGKYRTKADLKNSNRGAAFLDKYMNDRGLRILAALDEVAQLHNAPVAAVSLAWIMKRPSLTAPIASATTIDQLKQLVLALDLTLSNDDMDQLNTASADQ
ncbi:aldo/keto reductase [Desulfovibrio inopinatus]|uniref:aldo/keto reductase n=1 Tax=Desulfovibrio inopinatus TaxID=102109 RepID=UPI000416B6B6|nr:aldo/keto reductase [Desulfovibrio inopinatus]